MVGVFAMLRCAVQLSRKRQQPAFAMRAHCMGGLRSRECAAFTASRVLSLSIDAELSMHAVRYWGAVSLPTTDAGNVGGNGLVGSL